MNPDMDSNSPSPDTEGNMATVESAAAAPAQRWQLNGLTIGNWKPICQALLAIL